MVPSVLSLFVGSSFILTNIIMLIMKVPLLFWTILIIRTLETAMKERTKWSRQVIREIAKIHPQVEEGIF